MSRNLRQFLLFCEAYHGLKKCTRLELQKVDSVKLFQGHSIFFHSSGHTAISRRQSCSIDS